MSEIKIDIAPVVAELNALKKEYESLLFEDVPDNVVESFLTLLEHLTPNVVITSTSTAPITNDHIIRLGVGGDFKIRAATFAAIKSEFVIH